MLGKSRYAVALFTLVLLLGVGASYTVAALIQSNDSHTFVPLDGVDTFSVSDPRLIRPRHEDVARFERADAAWRAANAPYIQWQSLIDVPWHASARQIVTDSAYRLVSAGRISDAIPVLTTWVSLHPTDAPATLDLARLLNSVGRTSDAITRYRDLLEFNPTLGARTELAGILLAAGQYDDAAAQYRILLRSDDTRVAYHLALAQAFAWGDRPRDADSELRWLTSRGFMNTQVLELLHSVRASIDPTAAEAKSWVADQPDWTPYRMAYARALLASGRAREGAAQLDTVLLAGENVPLLREAAGAHGAAGDSVAASSLLGRAVAMLPDDDSLRTEYARALAWKGDPQGAIAQYSRVIERRPDAELYFARGQLYAWSGAEALAEADLQRAADLHATYDAYALLGDVRRWRGDYRVARAAYRQALALRPDDPRVRLAMREIDDAERLYIASVPDAESGWVMRSSFVSDNAGFRYQTLGAASGWPITRSTTLSVGAEVRHIARASSGVARQSANGFGIEGRLTQRVSANLSITAAAGRARHSGVRDIGTGSVGASWSARRLSLTGQFARGPVYESLRSFAALVPAPQDALAGVMARPLIGRTTSLTAALPLGRALLELTGEQLDLSDGNRRRTVSASVRVALNKHVSAVYQGGTTGYARRSLTYWDPSSYQSHSLGVEVNTRGPVGSQVAVHAMPGLARAEEFGTEVDGRRTLLPSRNVLQMDAGAEIAWQRDRLGLTAGVEYGRARTAGYQSVSGTLRVHIAW
jgi:tetratricopeptide (TPR) repeat protein